MENRQSTGIPLAATLPIRVLHLEDDPLAARLIAQSLNAAGFRCQVVVASDRRGYESAIRSQAFDLILCDYNLPDYDGLSALRFARTEQPCTPVIMISGTLSEEDAVECLRAGASDYVLKQGLQRLGRAAQKALDEAANQKEKRLAEIERRSIEQKFLDLFELAPYGIVICDNTDTIKLVNRRAEQMFGYSREELIGKPVSILTPPASAPMWTGALAQFATANGSIDIDFRELVALRKDGTIFPVEISVSQIRTETGPMIAATLRGLKKPSRAADA
jgi:PAS domain S-box-containing protein